MGGSIIGGRDEDLWKEGEEERRGREEERRMGGGEGRRREGMGEGERKWDRRRRGRTELEQRGSAVTICDL